jgi:hypothetical protein
MPGFATSALAVFLIALLLVFVRHSPGYADRSGAALSGLRPYLVQMHIHGHSNHNGNSLPASMESQCYEAVKNGFDVIWWTDHAALFGGFEEDITIDFKEAVFDPESTTVIFSRGMARALTRVDIERSSGGGRLELADGSLAARIESGRGMRSSEKVGLRLASEKGEVNLVDYCRPVASGLKFMMWGRVEGLGDDTRVRLEFGFSWHPAGQHHAVFDLVPRTAGGGTVVGDTTVTSEVEIAGQDLELVLDLESALAALPNGDDNTLSSTRIEIAARNGAPIEVVIDSLRLASTKPDGGNQYRTVERLARRYRDSLGIIQHIGVEVGLLHLPRMPHMNAFLPGSKSTCENIRLSESLLRDEWIDAVQAMGGIVAVDHPFGAALRLKYVDGQDLPPDLSRRDLSQRPGLVNESHFRRVAAPIVQDGAWGADLLEVGYLFRGAGSLQDHLRLWDLALANGVRLMGFGSSDSHGGIWGPNMEPNPFATWIWSASPDADDLLDAMRAGKMFFGDPFLWKSDLSFGVGDALMGDTLFVDDGDEVPGWLHMEPWRGDVRVRLVQVEIRGGDELNIIRSDIVENVRGGFDIGVDGPCFARVEVYDDNGIPLAFSNPVFLIPG